MYVWNLKNIYFILLLWFWVLKMGIFHYGKRCFRRVKTVSGNWYTIYRKITSDVVSPKSDVVQTTSDVVSWRYNFQVTNWRTVGGWNCRKLYQWKFCKEIFRSSFQLNGGRVSFETQCWKRTGKRVPLPLPYGRYGGLLCITVCRKSREWWLFVRKIRSHFLMWGVNDFGFENDDVVIRTIVVDGHGFLDFVDYIESFNNLSEYGILSVKIWCSALLTINQPYAVRPR